MDLHAHLDKPITLKPGECKLVPTGVFIELPIGIEAQIRSRSGLALKHGVTVLNAPATIDSDYRGEYLAMLFNNFNESYTIQPGDRIAQVVFAKYETVEWLPVDEINTKTERSDSGFGSTGR